MTGTRGAYVNKIHLNFYFLILILS